MNISIKSSIMWSSLIELYFRNKLRYWYTMEYNFYSMECVFAQSIHSFGRTNINLNQPFEIKLWIVCRQQNILSCIFDSFLHGSNTFDLKHPILICCSWKFLNAQISSRSCDLSVLLWLWSQFYEEFKKYNLSDILFERTMWIAISWRNSWITWHWV